MIVYILCIVTVTRQGKPVTGPLLVFHSEIPRTTSDDSLICSHPTRTDVAWHLPNGNILLDPSKGGTFNNVISGGRRQAEIRRGTPNNDDRGLDGLWTCRLNGAAGAGAFPVGIYDDSPTSSKINFLFRLTSHSKILNSKIFWVLISTFFVDRFIPLNTLQNNHVTDIQHNHIYIAHKKKNVIPSEHPSNATRGTSV